jgi:hypothetical protein
MLQLEHDEQLYVRLSKAGLDRSRLFSWEKTALDLREFYNRVVFSGEAETQDRRLG